MGRRGIKAFRKTLGKETAVPTGRGKFGEEQTTPAESRTAAHCSGARERPWECLAVAAIIQSQMHVCYFVLSLLLIRKYQSSSLRGHVCFSYLLCWVVNQLDFKHSILHLWNRSWGCETGWGSKARGVGTGSSRGAGGHCPLRGPVASWSPRGHTPCAGRLLSSPLHDWSS